MLAIGCGENHDICEVYDSVCKKFVVFNSHPTFFDDSEDQAISIGRNILVFKRYSKKVAIYNVDHNEWSEKYFDFVDYGGDFHCLKIPSLKFWFL